MHRIAYNKLIKFSSVYVTVAQFTANNTLNSFKKIEKIQVTSQRCLKVSKFHSLIVRPSLCSVDADWSAKKTFLSVNRFTRWK